MFNLGLVEMLVLGVIALLVIGPKQLPEVARTLARIINELKHATGDLTDSLRSVKSDVTGAINDVQKSVGNPQEWVDKVSDDIKNELNQPIKQKPDNENKLNDGNDDGRGE